MLRSDENTDIKLENPRFRLLNDDGLGAQRNIWDFYIIICKSDVNSILYSSSQTCKFKSCIVQLDSNCQVNLPL